MSKATFTVTCTVNSRLTGWKEPGNSKPWVSYNQRNGP